MKSEPATRTLFDVTSSHCYHNNNNINDDNNNHVVAAAQSNNKNVKKFYRHTGPRTVGVHQVSRLVWVDQAVSLLTSCLIFMGDVS